MTPRPAICLEDRENGIKRGNSENETGARQKWRQELKHNKKEKWRESRTKEEGWSRLQGEKRADESDLKLKSGKPMWSLKEMCQWGSSLHVKKSTWREDPHWHISLRLHYPWLPVHFSSLTTWEKVILQMNIYRPCSSPFFVLAFYYLFSLIAGRHRISFVVTALPPRPFKQACDKYNDDGLDALYHHLELGLYESRSHITMKYSSTPLYPSLSFPTLIHGMRLTNPMICLIIWSQIWA